MTHYTVLQNFVFCAEGMPDAPQSLFYRGNATVTESGSLLISELGHLRFDTEFNLVNVRKWLSMCHVDDLSLHFDIYGQFDVRLHLLTPRESGEEWTELLSCDASTLLSNGGKLTIPLEHFASNVHHALLTVSLYVKKGQRCELKRLTLETKTPSQRPTYIAAGICTFNRQHDLDRNLRTLGRFVREQCLPVHFIVSNNGDDLLDDYSDEPCTILRGRNIGGAGGFTRAIRHALNTPATHVLLMDDDIVCPTESIFRVVRITQYLKNEHTGSLISGSMVSARDSWIQYERNASLTRKGFHHHGHLLDLRAPSAAFENALAMPTEGIAGWWFCTIPVQQIRKVGLPLPIFIRGDDVEFSLRLDTSIISWNGVLVWHQPFDTKYSDMMEDYFLVRNMSLLSILYDRPHLLTVFFIRKCRHNIRTFNYLGAQLNIQAFMDLLEGRIWEDPKVNFDRIAQIVKGVRKFRQADTPPQFGRHAWAARARWRRGITKAVQMITPLINSQGHARAGFERDPRSFIGRSKVYVYDRFTGTEELTSLERRTIIALNAKLLNLVIFYHCKRKTLKKQLTQHCEQYRALDSWDSIFAHDTQAIKGISSIVKQKSILELT